MSFPHLVETGSIGSLMLANRIVMPAMATNLASAGGEPTDRLIAYYAERARGGAGLVIVENATIEHHLGGNGAVQLRVDHDRYVPALHRLADAIHAGGAAVALQINHAGANARTGAAGVPPLSPSGVTWGDRPIELQAMSLVEIERTTRFAHELDHIKPASTGYITEHVSENAVVDDEDSVSWFKCSAHGCFYTAAST